MYKRQESKARPLFTDVLNEANFSGRAFDSIEITGMGGGEPRNRAPKAEDQSLSLPDDTTSDIQLGVSDLDGPGPYTFTVVSGPTNGVLGNDDGDALLTYTPNTGYAGPDSFTFRVNDGIDDSAEATVSLVIGGPTVKLRGYTEFFAGGIGTNETILAKPDGVTAGDLMIAVMTHGASGVVITPPEGWSLVRDDTVVDQLVFPVYQKIAGPSEPDSYTFSLSRKKHPVAALLAFRGGIINDHGGGNSDISATTQVAPSINAASEDVLLYVAAVRSDATFTPPPGMIELTDGEDTSRALTTALELATDSGPTGTRSGTSSSDGVWAAALISITTLTE